MFCLNGCFIFRALWQVFFSTAFNKIISIILT